MNYNNQYNRFMDKIDTSDYFKEKLIQEMKKQNVAKPSLHIKIKNKMVALISTISIFSIGGVAFAAKMPDEWKTAIKEFFGIVSNNVYQEQKIDANLTQFDNGYQLTIENYGIDSEHLLLNYSLKTEKEIDLQYPFVEGASYLFTDELKIINKKGTEFTLNQNKTILIDKINSQEYKIYEIYSINTENIDDGELNVKFNLKELVENLDGIDYKNIASFNFNLPVNKSMINSKYEEYEINEKIEWDSEVIVAMPQRKETHKAYLNINKMKNTNFTTKFDVLINGIYHTNTDYTISITDENNNTILNRDIEYLYGAVAGQIIIPAINMNSKIKITLYEEKDGTDIANESIELDLSKLDSLK